jgi:hypothetical protein
MQRFFRGLMLAASVGVLWGCGDDPLAEGAGDAANLEALPAALFINAGDSKSTTVALRDAGGGARAAEFEILAVDNGITVVRDESFLPEFDSDGNLLPPTSANRVRYSITAGPTPGVYSFQIGAGGQTATIPVRVMPVEVTGTLSSAAVSCNEGITYTVAAPVGFAPSASVATDLGAAVNVSVSGDGRSITFFPEPGSSGTFDVLGATIDFVPGLTLASALESVEEITSVAADCDQGDAPADPGTAPLFTNGFLDSYATAGGGDAIGGGGDTKFYKITVTADGNYDLQMNWPNDADLDFYVVDPTFSEFLSTDGATGANPELVEDLHLAPGEYYIAVVLFDGTAPDYFKFNFFEHVAEE